MTVVSANVSFCQPVDGVFVGGVTWDCRYQAKDVKPLETRGPGGDRTLDLRIKSPLLCRLSYRPA